VNHFKTAYILLWFPKPSETFVYKEVINLKNMGLSLEVFTLYGPLSEGLSPEMEAFSHGVERLGLRYLIRAPADLLHWWKKNPRKLMGLLGILCTKPCYDIEKMGENLWACLCALHLARRFEESQICHIHAPWASGPATAAWVASGLTGIPFSFTARAWDIYPPDGILREKIRDAALIRSETKQNIQYLAQFADRDLGKIRLTYNGVPLSAKKKVPVPMTSPYRLLALGRFVGKKGYDYLIYACKILKDAGLDFRLILAGDGPKKNRLMHLAQGLDLLDIISMPGFITHDHVSDLFQSTDIFLMPSVVDSSGDRDGIPTVIMESLLHGVPVIATRVSGIPELIEDDITGLLIPEKDPPAIARAVMRMIGNRQSAVDMAERGRSRVLKQFDPKKNTELILRLYRQYIPSSLETT